MRFVNSNMEDLISKAMNQNFVPVIDDKRIFIVFVTRKDIIEFCYNEYTKKENKSRKNRQKIKCKSIILSGKS